MDRAEKGGRPRLASVKLLGNHGAQVVYRHRSGNESERFVPANGYVTVLEAARMLDCHTMRLHRLHVAGKLRFSTRKGKPALVTLGDVRRLLRSA